MTDRSFRVRVTARETQQSLTQSFTLRHQLLKIRSCSASSEVIRQKRDWNKSQNVRTKHSSRLLLQWLQGETKLTHHTHCCMTWYFLASRPFVNSFQGKWFLTNTTPKISQMSQNQKLGLGLIANVAYPHFSIL